MAILKLLVFALSRLFSCFLKTVTFIFKHWRVFLPLAIVVLGLWKINALTAQRNDALKIHAAHIADDVAEAEKRRQENVAKYLKADADLALSNYRHQTEVNVLKGVYESRIKKTGDTAAANDSAWRERVRLEVGRNSSYGLLGDTGDIQGSAGGERDCDAATARQAYETLELACAVTTSDYNSLRRWADGACRIHECK